MKNLFSLMLLLSIATFAFSQQTAEDYLKSGNASFAQASYDKAVSDYSKAIELNQKSAEAFFDRGAAYGKQNLYKEALHDYSTAISLDPTYADAWFNRAITYENLSQPEKAKENYYKAGEIYKQLGKTLESEKAFKLAQ
jgi:tetratricopeptide (TPR) repeat protein